MRGSEMPVRYRSSTYEMSDGTLTGFNPYHVSKLYPIWSILEECEPVSFDPARTKYVGFISSTGLRRVNSLVKDNALEDVVLRLTYQSAQRSRGCVLVFKSGDQLLVSARLKCKVR